MIIKCIRCFANISVEEGKRVMYKCSGCGLDSISYGYKNMSYGAVYVQSIHGESKPRGKE